MAKKRSCGEGAVRKMKSGNWRGELMDGYKDDGRRNIVYFSGKTKAEVLAKIREHLDLKAKHVTPNKTMTLEEWADAWYEDYRTQVQPSTYSGYKYTLSIIKDKLGSQLMHQILPIHINRFMDSLVKANYSMSQIRKCRAMLIQIFDAADGNGLIPFNPARKAKIIRDLDGTLSAPRREKDAFTADEVAALEILLPDDLTGNSIRLLLNTGMRVQELLALTVNDIAKDGSTITVNKAIKMVDGLPTLGCTKSKKGNRIIPIPCKARKYALKVKAQGGKELIWTKAGDNPYFSVGTFRRKYYSALKEIPGVRPLSPHCCRHTYITMLQERCVPIETVARLAGHSSIDTTDHYTHISVATLANAVKVLEESEASHVA